MIRRICASLFCFALLASSPSRGQESLLIGPGDQLHVQVLDTPEMEQHPRVTDGGTIPLIGIGDLPVAGLTPSNAALKIQQALIKANYMNHPAVTVTVDQYATQNISVLGEVKTPGTFNITAPRSVLDAVAMAGGLTSVADRHITIQRHDKAVPPISYNLSNDGKTAVETQVLVYPGDEIIVPHAGITYVLGDVFRPGGIVMQNNRSELTAVQAVALAGGTQTSAVPSRARLIRRTPGGGYTEIAINFSDMQKGKSPDMQLQPEDIIYIPFSYIRNIDSNSSGIVAAAASASIYALP